MNGKMRKWKNLEIEENPFQSRVVGREKRKMLCFHLPLTVNGFFDLFFAP